MDLGIAGRSAIVCAGSRGLGRGCAVHLADAGCTLYLNGRNAEVTQRTAEEIRQRSGAKVVASNS